MRKKTKIHARVPKSLKEAFAKKCKKQGVYQTDILEALVSKWTKRN
jgi:predicted DNA binding CopG/RHH family protein